MDLNKFIELLMAAVGGWLVMLEVRLYRTQNKVVKLEQGAKDEKIKNRVHSLSDDELDALLNEDLGSKRPNS